MKLTIRSHKLVQRLHNSKMKGIFITATVALLISFIVFFIGNTNLYRKRLLRYKAEAEFMKNGFLEASKLFNASHLDVDLGSKVFLVTGVSSPTGLGYATAWELVKRNATVHILCRKEKGMECNEASRSLIRRSNNYKVKLHVADLSDQKDILRFVESFKKISTKLDVLINNAGTLHRKRVKRRDGLEGHFATNTLGTYILTRELIPLLSESNDGRVIFVSSGRMYTENLISSNFTWDKDREYDGVVAYSQSKRQLVVLAEELAKTHPQIYFASMHPGFCNTYFTQTVFKGFYQKYKDQLRHALDGADTIVWLAASHKEVLHKFPSGSFFQDRQAVSPHLPFAFTSSSESQNQEFMTNLNDFLQK